jgi:hypothetical protein
MGKRGVPVKVDVVEFMKFTGLIEDQRRPEIPPTFQFGRRKEHHKTPPRS